MSEKLFHVCVLRVIEVKNPAGNYNQDMVEDFYNLTREKADKLVDKLRGTGEITLYPQQGRHKVDHEIGAGSRTIKMQRGSAKPQQVAPTKIVRPARPKTEGRPAPLHTPSYADLVNRMGAGA